MSGIEKLSARELEIEHLLTTLSSGSKLSALARLTTLLSPEFDIDHAGLSERYACRHFIEKGHHINLYEHLDPLKSNDEELDATAKLLIMIMLNMDYTQKHSLNDTLIPMLFKILEENKLTPENTGNLIRLIDASLDFNEAVFQNQIVGLARHVTEDTSTDITDFFFARLLLRLNMSRIVIGSREKIDELIEVNRMINKKGTPRVPLWELAEVPRMNIEALTAMKAGLHPEPAQTVFTRAACDGDETTAPTPG